VSVFSSNQDVFKGLEDENDEDLEISQMVEQYKNQGGTVLGELLFFPLSCKDAFNMVFKLKRNFGLKFFLARRGFCMRELGIKNSVFVF